MRTIEPGVYRHFKGGFYDVLYVAEDATDDMTNHGQVVVYRSWLDWKIYVRELREFGSTVNTAKYPNADQKYRFERMEASE